jgi:hypothetical protein
MGTKIPYFILLACVAFSGCTAPNSSKAGTFRSAPNQVLFAPFCPHGVKSVTWDYHETDSVKTLDAVRPLCNPDYEFTIRPDESLVSEDDMVEESPQHLAVKPKSEYWQDVLKEFQKLAARRPD